MKVIEGTTYVWYISGGVLYLQTFVSLKSFFFSKSTKTGVIYLVWFNTFWLYLISCSAVISSSFRFLKCLKVFIKSNAVKMSEMINLSGYCNLVFSTPTIMLLVYYGKAKEVYDVKRRGQKNIQNKAVQAKFKNTWKKPNFTNILI